VTHEVAFRRSHRISIELSPNPTFHNNKHHFDALTEHNQLLQTWRTLLPLWTGVLLLQYLVTIHILTTTSPADGQRNLVNLSLRPQVFLRANQHRPSSYQLRKDFVKASALLSCSELKLLPQSSESLPTPLFAKSDNSAEDSV
jgi:hypothetical protein